MDSVGYWIVGGVIAAAFAFWNAKRAKAQGYFFWRTFIFTIILEVAVAAILVTNLYH
jgi:uncharacterized membrane protein HdeD (DUF308 family)